MKGFMILVLACIVFLVFPPLGIVMGIGAFIYGACCEHWF